MFFERCFKILSARALCKLSSFSCNSGFPLAHEARISSAYIAQYIGDTLVNTGRSGPFIKGSFPPAISNDDVAELVADNPLANDLWKAEKRKM